MQRRARLRRWLAPWSSLFWLRRWNSLRLYRRLFDGEVSAGGSSKLRPLTAEQREAVVTNESATLVVASAGSGKTAVVVAKVAYLVHSGKATPEDILLLAFNRAAAEEMRGRCLAVLGTPVTATTFNALGLSILKQSGVATRKVSKLAEDGRQFATFMSNALTELSADPVFARAAGRLIRIDRAPPFRKRHLHSLAEYEAHVRAVELRTLRGELVKSRGELEIANYLYVRGIPYEYEVLFGEVVADGPRDYLPDFYLPDAQLFIEFFGLDRKGQTASGIDAAEYARQADWKRRIHAEHGTRLVECFSWQRTEGKLQEALDAALVAHGVHEEPVDPRRLLDEFNSLDWESEFSSLVLTFLSQFRSNGLTLESLRSKASVISGLEGERQRAFVEMFAGLLRLYQQALADEGAIDFADMIAGAAAALRDRLFSPRWRYVIVDEFQDMSFGRYRLLQAILASKSTPKLFAVGDDWQSINRFAGADASLMTSADRYFHRPVAIPLNQTFRFGPRLATLSGSFVSKNPEQIPKNVTSNRADGPRPTGLWWTSWDRDRALIHLVSRIAAEEDVKGRSLLVLARYKKFLPTAATLRRLAEVWPGDLVTPSTIHSAKGLEADYVVLLEIRDVIPAAIGGRLSVPSSLSDDPILALVMPSLGAFPHAEERRLLYVGLSRAKMRVDLICNRLFPSTFATELAGHSGVTVLGAPASESQCLICLARRTDAVGRITWSASKPSRCSNPDCGFEPPNCERCRTGFLMPIVAGSRLKCVDAMCGHEGEPLDKRVISGEALGTSGTR